MEEKHLTRAILIGADTGEYDAESSMDELSELAKTAGAEELARVLQKREAYQPATVIGEGKLAEVKELCGSLGAELLIFDCELPRRRYETLKTKPTSVSSTAPC